MPAGSIAVIFDESCGFEAIFCAIGFGGVVDVDDPPVFEPLDVEPPVVEPPVVELPVVEPDVVDGDPLVDDPLVVDVDEVVGPVVVAVLCALPRLFVVVVFDEP